MILQNLRPQVNITSRVWRLTDAEFIVSVRNTPELQQWFKQDSNLTISEQREFMALIAPDISYYGFIVEVNDKPIGFTSLILHDNKSAEMGIGILPKYQGKGFTLEAVRQIVSIAFNEFQCKRVFGDVFVTNPALSFYLHKCGFRATHVQERKYMKKGLPVDVVYIEQTRP